jgi:hypothetical protein
MGKLSKKSKGCPCGDIECDKTDVGEGLLVEGKPFLSNKEYNILHKRTHLEKWLDQYNHIMEFSRTVIQLLALILQLVILWKLFS